MVDNRIVKLTQGIIEIFADHGFNEEARDLLEYNDSDDIESYIKSCLEEVDRKKLQDHSDKYRWDEEFDLSCEDHSVGSLAQCLGVLFKKHNLIKPEKEVFEDVELKEIVETKYIFTCPNCMSKRTTILSDCSGDIEESTCRNCGVRVKFKKD